MIYRRMLPLAIGGATALAGGFLGLFKGENSQKRYSGSHLNDSGLNKYTFVDSKQFQLLNATVLVRHGARTPNYFVDSNMDMPDWENGYGYVDTLPQLNYDVDIKDLQSMQLVNENTVMDEYIDHVKGKCQIGQLTLIGQEQSLSFGQELRRIYINGHKLLNSEFNEDEIYCRSTKFPRTFYTLKAILSGIYGIQSFDQCHRPIIHTNSILNDSLYANTSLCSVLEKFSEAGAAEIAKDFEIIRMKCLLKEALGVDSLSFASVEKKTKKEQRSCDKSKPIEIKTINPNETVAEDISIYAVRDDFYSRQVHEFPIFNKFSLLLPELDRLSTEEILYEHLGGSVEWEDRIIFILSPLINIMKTKMEEVLSRPQEKSNACLSDMRQSLTKKKAIMKMQLISCHDTTIIPLLVCLRIYDNRWPIFTSNIIIELYKEICSENIFTRFIYNGKVQHIKIADGETCQPEDAYSKIGLIPYEKFIKILSAYSIPEDKYLSACDKALKLFSSGRPVVKDQYL